MKKILLLLITVLTLTLIACVPPSPQQELIALMDDITPPEYTDVGAFWTDEVWLTKKVKLNEHEWIYYAPRSVEIDGEVFLNDEEAFYMMTIDEDEDVTWSVLEDADIEAIVDAVKPEFSWRY